jgi:hypothetical protein
MSKHSIQNDSEIQNWVEEQKRKYWQKSHSIKFAEFVTNHKEYEDFCFMSVEQQEKIYEEFIKQTQNERQ